MYNEIENNENNTSLFTSVVAINILASKNLKR